jgi:hypothetical protein
MASKKILKKNLNNMVFDIVEECFSMQMWNPEKAAQTEEIIDAAANFQDDMLMRINAAKTKSDFRPIRSEIENAAIDFINKLNDLN